jgi:hypothetical protein
MNTSDSVLYVLLMGCLYVLGVLVIIRFVGFIFNIPVLGGKVCPMCKSRVHKDAKICRFCQHKFEDSQF